MRYKHDRPLKSFVYIAVFILEAFNGVIKKSFDCNIVKLVFSDFELMLHHLYINYDDLKTGIS